MFIGLFKKEYTVRRFAPQMIEKGYASAAFSDISIILNVQPLSTDDLQALPEGERTVKRIKAIGKEKLQSADEFTGTPADRLFYDGLWYECTASNKWAATALAHYDSQFV